MTPEMIMGIVLLMLCSFFMGGAVGKAIARDEAKEACDRQAQRRTTHERNNKTL